MRTGLILSVVILLISLGVICWPLLQNTRFWVTIGIGVGMVGTFFFAVALNNDDKKEP